MASQVTFESLLYQVVAIKVPGFNVTELLDAISLNPEELLVVDRCHLYSSVPVCPVGRDKLVISAAVNGLQPA